MKFVRAIIAFVAPVLPKPRVIFDRSGRSPYLSRYYLIGKSVAPDGQSPFNATGNPREGVTTADRFQLYLHRFHRSDEDLALHNHPWEWSLSLVLAGGYSEERRVGDDVVRRTIKPLSFNFIRGSDFHRVDLLEEDAWTLFLVGPKVSSWGFWNRHSKIFTPWREFITQIRGEGWAES